MSQVWLPSVQSALRFARRNAGKIALFTVAAGSAIAATTYIRRQISAVDESMQQERAEGARRLRAAFIANTNTVKAAFCALLPLAREVLLNTEQINSSAYIERLRSKPKDRAEKQELWEKVKLSSLTHLVSAIYIVALLHSFLLLQMNLLARYTNSSPNAPVQSLPAGQLTGDTSKRFLDLSRARILARGRVDAIVRRVEELVQSNMQDVSLAKRISLSDVEGILTNILGAIEAEKSHGDGDDEGNLSAGCDNPLISVHIWLLNDSDGSQDSADGTASVTDRNLEWLVQESLDLCEVLDFQGVVESSTYIVLAHALSCLREQLDPNVPQLPYAQFLARFDRVASELFATVNENGDEENVSETLSPLQGLGRSLSESEDSARFGASVFLSGEKESERSSRFHGSRFDRSPFGRQPLNNAFVTNISADGEELGREGNDLGLMFDIN